jgi:hypothetical protein
MEPEVDTPNLGETEDTPIYDRAIAVRRTREGEASVAPPALAAGIARRLTRFEATEERLEGALKAHYDILQDVSVDLAKFWTRRLEIG